MSTHDAGWYSDPEDPSAVRYWDGDAWVDQGPVGSDAEVGPASRSRTSFEDGTWLVGSDIEPGVYRSGTDGVGDYVIWKRLSSVRGDRASRIEGGMVSRPALVEIIESDFAFESRGSGGWTRVSGPTPIEPPPTVEFDCEVCKKTQIVLIGTRRHVCAECGTVYRWQQCSVCKVEGQRVLESYRSWICGICGGTTQSYWVPAESQYATATCVKCSTSCKYPAGSRTFTCPSCSSPYTKCPGCGTYVTNLADPDVKGLTCPKCSVSFNR